MNCIHGLGSSGIDYVLSNILIYNKIIDFEILNDHEQDSNHRALTLTLNFVKHNSPIEENSYNQKQF